MIPPRSTVLEGHGVRLEPLAREHHDGLVAAAGDGELWTLWFTSVPAPAETHAYIAAALAGQDAGHMLPWAVRELDTGAIVGSTRYHDIVSAVDRVEIGYTWYAHRCQKTHINTACKLLLLGHAFGELGCAVVGFRTDNFNFASQAAIARARREEGRGHPPPSVTPRRHRARYRDVQHSCDRVARREAASGAAARASSLTRC